MNNTINVEKILSNNQNKISSSYLDYLKHKYSINKKDKVIIYIARFIKERRLDLLIELIELMKNDSCVFLICGTGEHQYDFTNYDNVRYIRPL